jgi:hypothetical protein
MEQFGYSLANPLLSGRLPTIAARETELGSPEHISSRVVDQAVMAARVGISGEAEVKQKPRLGVGWSSS